MKASFKKFLKVILPLILIVGIVGGSYVATRPKTVAGQKTIELQLIDGRDEENIIELGDLQVILVDEDNSLYLGDAIDYVNENDEDFFFVLSDPSEYGRMIEGIMVNSIDDIFQNTDTLFWMIDSENNPQCIEDGFCSGIDAQAIFDGDIFKLTYLIPEW